jgi:hypothetical protein
MQNPFKQRVTTLGETVGRNIGQRFGIYQSDRLFHMFILGQTGTGKSTLMLNMMRQDITHGYGFCLLDPHGDLAEAIKPDLPEHAIYWDIANPDCPYGYNPLTYVAEQYRPLVASGIIDTLKNQWADAWGVRMEHLLRFALLALLSRPNSSLEDIIPMFTNKTFRNTVLKSVTDPQVLKFWNEEYAKMNYKNAFDGVAPIANKLGAFLSNPNVRKSLCNPEQPLRFRRIMDEGTPLVVNLSKGRLGTDVSNVLGGLILSMTAQAAYTRENLPQRQRRPFITYVDEFHSFTTDSLAGMLSELRKFKCGLVLVGQHTTQVSRAVLDSILGNVGTFIVFRLGAQDAPLISRQLGEVNPADIINLPNYRMFLKLMIDSVQTMAFSAVTIKRR